MNSRLKVKINSGEVISQERIEQNNGNALDVFLVNVDDKLRLLYIFVHHKI